MSRVVIGAYREGLSLSQIFRSFSDTKSDYDAKESDFTEYFASSISSDVYLTEQWDGMGNAWNPNYVGIIVTENDLKHWENDFPLRDTVFALEPKKNFIAGPDSIEAEQTAIDIARGKAIIGLLEPVEDATTRELSEALDAIGAEDAKHVLVMSEDREMIVPVILREASVWDSYRDLPMIEECFREGEAFPGRRVNELQNATGGAVNFLLLLEAAREEMREKGHEVVDEHKSYVSYYMKFLEYDPSQPIPEEGLFITASELDRKFRPVTPKDIAMEKAGHQLDMNDFDMPAHYQGEYDDRQNPVTISMLRTDMDSRYFSYDFASARAMRAFAEVMDIPKLDKPRTNETHDVPGAKFISNLNFGEVAFNFDRDSAPIIEAQQFDLFRDIEHEFDSDTIQSNGSEISEGRVSKDIKDEMPEIIFPSHKLNGDYYRSEDQVRIESHEDLERAFLSAEGLVIEPWPKQAPEGMGQDLYELEQKMLARLAFSYRATVKPFGEKSAMGRPFMVNRDVRQNEMSSYHNAMKFRTVTSRADHVFKGFSDADEFRDTMSRGQWETKYVKPMPKAEDYNLSSTEEIEEIIGHKPLGFVEALLGSASSHLHSGNEDAYKYTYETSQKTVTIMHGGASRHIMGQFIRGSIDAQEEGYDDFLSIGVRVPLASRKEGSLKPLLREYDLEVEAGDHDGNYLCFGDEKFHSLTYDHMGERQHTILAHAHIVTAFIGGIGTDYEDEMAMYHNLMVEMRGYGIFPGSEHNEQKKRIHFVNSTVHNGGDRELGFYDEMKNSLTPEQWDVMNVHFYDTVDAALEARDEYAEELGYNLDQPREHLDHQRRFDLSDEDELGTDGYVV